MAQPGTSASQIAGCNEEKDTLCDVCGLSDKDQLCYGEFIQKLGFKLHYFCMLSCTKMLQLGKHDSSGIYGFLPVDIRDAIKLVKDKICAYCDKVNCSD